MKSIDILNKIATFAFRERFKILTLKINIMNKAQLIDAIAEKAGLTKADSKKALEAFVETVGEALKGGDKVAMIGFGSATRYCFIISKGNNADCYFGQPLMWSILFSNPFVQCGILFTANILKILGADASLVKLGTV